MNREQSTMFDLIKASVFGAKIHLQPSLNWQKIFEEMKIQTIVAVPYEWISECEDVDDTLKRQCGQIAMQQIAFQCQLLHEQEQLLQFLRSHDIHVAILKGCAAAMYYPQPEYRMMGDVDFLVKENEVQKAHQLLKENGYKELYEENHSEHHYVFEKNGISFELHLCPAGVAKLKNNTANLKELFQKGLEHVEFHSIAEYEFPVMPRQQNGLVLLLHVYSHLVEGLGLRQIMDWMMFVDKHLDDEVWEKEFQPVLQKAGLEDLATTVTKLCQKWMGLRTEGITWCENADEALCEELLKYLLEKGNFGRKEGEKGKAATVFSRGWGIVDIFKSAQKNGRIYWKVLKKYPWLWPFAWISEISRYIKYVFSRKNFIRTLIKDKKTGNERIKLFRKLGR